MLESIHNRIRMIIFDYFTKYPINTDSTAAQKIHTHSFYELFILLEGDINYTIDSRLYDLCSTQLIIVPPEHRHAMIENDENDQNTIVRGLLIQFEISPQDRTHPVFALLQTPQVIQLNSIPEVVTLIHTVSHHNILFTKDELHLLEETYVLQLLMLLYKLSYVMPNIDHKINHITVHILAYINQHLTEQLSVQSIAHTLKFNESYITKVFKKDIGTSIMLYIKNRRMLLAQSLIFGGERPIQAMYKSGFNDYSNFFKEFKKVFGVTPKQMWVTYRKEAPQGKIWPSPFNP